MCRVAAEDFFPFGIGKIELPHLIHRVKIAHRHRIVRTDDDPVRAAVLPSIDQDVEAAGNAPPVHDPVVEVPV